MRRLAARMSGGRWQTAKPERGSLEGFEEAMNDDLDTPRAISWIERTLERGAKERSERKKTDALAAAVASSRVLGVDLTETPDKA